VHEFVEIPAAERGDRVPFVYAADAARGLRRLTMSGAIVDLVEDRRRYWQMLQYLAGQHLDRLTARHDADIAELTARIEESTQARDASLDEIARAMAELATTGKASLAGGNFLGSPAAAGTQPSAAGGRPGAATAVADAPPVWLDPADQARCTDCKTCYQELPELFTKTTALIDGAARTVAQMIPGALERVPMTPDLERRIARVKATCDAEIIR